MFSYLMYGNFFDKRHKEVNDFDTFLEGGLIMIFSNQTDTYVQ